MAYAPLIFSDDLASFAGLSPTVSNAFLKASGTDTWTVEDAATYKTSLALNNVDNTSLSTWAGTNQITTLGTITTGTWQGTAISNANGGTGQDFSSSTGAISVSGGTFSAGDLSVANGGTGVSTFTANGVLLGNTANAITATAAITTNGALLIGGATPAVAVPTGTSGVTVTAGAGTLAISIGQAVGTGDTPTFTGMAAGSAAITAVADPSNAQDAATKAYVDATATGLDVKDSCVVATAAALPAVTYANGTAGVGATLTADANGALTVDGQAVTLNQRVLVKNQAAGAGLQNGIYQQSTLGDGSTAFVLTRTTDADTAAELTGGAFTFIETGTDNDDSGWVCTNDAAIVIGTTAITWSQFSGAGSITAGAGMTKSGNTLNVIGTADKITVSADAVTIAATYIGQNTITTLGTVTTGTWAGTTVAVADGGTGAVTHASNGVLLGAGAGAITSAKAAPTGAFVGTTDTQTLTNKVLTSPVLTTPQINDASSDHQYVFVASELTANRNVTLPVLGAPDTFVFADVAQTLTNKTLGGYLQPIDNATPATTNQTYAPGDDKVVYMFNTSGGVVTFDVSALISANTIGQTIVVKVTTGGSALTIDATGAKTIDGSQTLILEQSGDSATLICVGAGAAIVI